MPVFAETTCRSPSVSLFVTLLLRYEMIASPINHLFCFSVSAAQRPALAARGWDLDNFIIAVNISARTSLFYRCESHESAARRVGRIIDQSSGASLGWQAPPPVSVHLVPTRRTARAPTTDLVVTLTWTLGTPNSRQPPNPILLRGILAGVGGLPAKSTAQYLQVSTAKRLCPE
jgi:hypothetical protein